MKPAPLHALAEDAGLLIEWRDFAGARKTVTDEALRRVLTAMGLAADTDPAIARSRAELAAERAEGPALVVAEGAERLYLDGSLARRGADGGIAQMIQSEGKGAVDLPWTLEKGRIGLDLPSSPGYHTLEIEGRTLALALWRTGVPAGGCGAPRRKSTP